MSVIYDNRGQSHNLSKGAFDSVSLAKPNFASLVLRDYIDRPFESSFKSLMQDFNFNLTQSEEKLSDALWSTYFKPHLKKLGGWVWDLTKGAITKGVSQVAGLEPTTAAIVGAAEIILSQALGGWFDLAKGTKTIRLSSGQWVFIEDETSLKRRMLAQKKPEDPKSRAEIQKLVTLGFFISDALESDRVTVFDMERGASREVRIKQIREVPQDVANKCDNDKTLSSVRELWFYKYLGENFAKYQPNAEIMPDKNVIYEGNEYALLQRDMLNGLIEDDDGATQVVKIADLKPGFRKQTKGHQDGFFDVSGDTSIYAGQWVFVPARDSIAKEFDTKFELAVVCAILTDDRVQVYLAMDGEEKYVKDEDLLPLSKENQEILNSKNMFRKFKEAAANNLPMKARSYELGGEWAYLCAGIFANQDLKSIRKALQEKTKPPHQEQQKTKTKISKVKVKTIKETDVGQAQIGLAEKQAEPFIRSYVTEEAEDSGLGAGVILLAAAAVILLAAG